MKRQCMSLLVLGSLLLAPMSAFAARGEETDSDTDARQLGYKDPPKPLPPGGAAGTWAFFVIMGLLSVGVLFKSGKRSHLD